MLFVVLAAAAADLWTMRHLLPFCSDSDVFFTFVPLLAVQVDAKGDMEASLKSACSAFITCAVELVASPLLSWTNKVTHDRV